jgi:hypothetical protein
MRHVRHRAGAQRVVGRSTARLEPGVGRRQMKGRQVREKAQQDPTQTVKTMSHLSAEWLCVHRCADEGREEAGVKGGEGPFKPQVG